MNRYPEIDLLRTLAIILMVVYHGAYDLSVYYGWDIPIFEGAWLLMARATASLFVFLAGVSFAIAHERAVQSGNPWRRHLRRALTVLAAALLVTVATYIADPQTYVRFGILHLIGTGILLLSFFVQLKELNMLLGLMIITLGLWIEGSLTSSPLLIPFGFLTPGFRSVDYFPLLPWFGMMLLGYGIGYFLYVRSTRWRPTISAPPVLTWPGRHSLIIYLVHQPVLLALLWMMTRT